MSLILFRKSIWDFGGPTVSSWNSLHSSSNTSKFHLTPLVRVVAYHVIGCDPTIMGIAPVEAIRALCKKTGVDLKDVDLIEVNEAFAVHALAVQRELGIEKDRFNVNGGAIAIGHRLAASGTRKSAHLAYELKERNHGKIFIVQWLRNNVRHLTALQTKIFNFQSGQSCNLGFSLRLL